jgi:hypothetical protein
LNLREGTRDCNFITVLLGKGLEPQIGRIRLAEYVLIGRTEYEINAHNVLLEDSKKKITWKTQE